MMTKKQEFNESLLNDLLHDELAAILGELICIRGQLRLLLNFRSVQINPSESLLPSRLALQEPRLTHCIEFLQSLEKTPPIGLSSASGSQISGDSVKDSSPAPINYSFPILPFHE